MGNCNDPLRPSCRTAADPVLVEKVVLANRILYRQGVVDGFGHVSARHDQSPGHFLLARNMAPALVRRDDILTFDLDGEALDANGRRVYLERFIHAEIYRARPDVQAVVHSHSPSVIPFGVTQQPLRPIFHMSGFLGEGAALFEIRDVGGRYGHARQQRHAWRRAGHGAGRAVDGADARPRIDRRRQLGRAGGLPRDLRRGQRAAADRRRRNSAR